MYKQLWTNQVEKGSFDFVEIDYQIDRTENIVIKLFIGEIITESSGIVSGDRAIQGSKVESDCVPSL